MRVRTYTAVLIIVLEAAVGLVEAKDPEASFTPNTNPVLVGEEFSPRRRAEVRQMPVTELRGAGYLEIGVLRMVLDTDKTSVDLTRKVLKDAAKPGGDLVVFQKTNAATTEIRKRKSRCFNYTQLPPRSEQIYRTECDSTGCRQAPTGNYKQIEQPSICNEYGEDHYQARVDELRRQLGR